MKKILLLIIPCLTLFTGCNDNEFLRENADDFMTVENSYLNAAQFRAGLNHLYLDVRQNYVYRDNPDDYAHFGAGTDLFFRTEKGAAWTNWNLITPSYNVIEVIYARHFSLVTKANILLKQTYNPAVKWNNEKEKLEAQAEARFFRAYAYRYLGYLFGGVPVLKEPVTKPELGFTRNTRVEVYQACIEDFEFASKNLPTATSQPGRAVKAAALHYLAEMYIALGDETKDNTMYTNSIAAATELISGKVGDYHLMKQRHGWRKNVWGKDAFWDLFQMRSLDKFSNFSYQTGNKESVWAIQVDKYLTGGLPPELNTRTDQARTFWPAFWGYNNKFGYNGVARDWTGRGVAWLRPTSYFIYDVWSRSGVEDQRNAEYNINRIFKCPFPVGPDGKDDSTKVNTTYTTNLAAPGEPENIITLHPTDIIKKEWLVTFEDTMQRVYPRIMKLGSDWHYSQDPSNGFVLEFYAIRLAETYLVRAEAYLKAGQKGLAAIDINEVRGRANAKPVLEGNVDIDYILDERARELVGEELRTLTLCRMNKLVERAKKYGYSEVQQTVKEKNNLFPIPQKVRDANTQAPFPNNPGYDD